MEQLDRHLRVEAVEGGVTGPVVCVIVRSPDVLSLTP